MMNATRRDPSWEGDEIRLKTEVGYTDLINIGERVLVIHGMLCSGCEFVRSLTQEIIPL
jgi:hypothetical protein